MPACRWFTGSQSALDSQCLPVAFRIALSFFFIKLTNKIERKCVCVYRVSEASVRVCVYQNAGSCDSRWSAAPHYQAEAGPSCASQCLDVSLI